MSKRKYKRKHIKQYWRQKKNLIPEPPAIERNGIRIYHSDFRQLEIAYNYCISNRYDMGDILSLYARNRHRFALPVS